MTLVYKYPALIETNQSVCVSLLLTVKTGNFKAGFEDHTQLEIYQKSQKILRSLNK